MSERTVHAVVLRRRDAGESDRRLTLLTEEFGKLDALAKGARKSASRLAGSSDPLSASVMTLAHGKSNEFVTQSQPQSSFRGLRNDYERLTYGLALVELYDAFIPYHQPLPEAYRLLLFSLATLEHHEKPAVAMVWNELRLLELSGFLPSFDRCAVSGEVLVEGQPFLSPDAGGYVCDSCAGQYTDRQRVRAEVALGLARTAEQETAPMRLKFAEECLMALFPFCRHVAVSPLPANEACMMELRHRATNEGGST